MLLKSRHIYLRFLRKTDTARLFAAVEESRDELDQYVSGPTRLRSIAEQTGYIWPKVEALELLVTHHQTRAALPGLNNQDERDLQKRYAKEAESIKRGLYLTEAQMEKLKVQARKEFEQQTAGWED